VKSRYKYVRFLPNSCPGGRRTARDLKVAAERPWLADPMIWNPVTNRSHSFKCKRFANERDAALHVDMVFIGVGREPVNILKRKPCAAS